MITITKSVANSDTLADFNSFIRRAFPPVKFACDFDCSYICDPCGLPFKYYVENNSVLHLQYSLPDFYNPDPTDPESGWSTGLGSWLQADILNMDGTVAIENVTLPAYSDIYAGFGVGYTGGQGYQNLNLFISDALKSQLNGDCFQVRVTFCGRSTDLPRFAVVGLYAELPPVGEFRNGDNIFVDNTYYLLANGSWVVVSPQPDAGIVWVQNEGLWYDWDGESFTALTAPGTSPDCEVFNTCISPPFKIDNCGGLVCFEAEKRINRDCSGKYYGLEGLTQQVGNAQYINKFCALGSLESVGFEIERERSSGGAVTVEKKREVYRLRTIVPQMVAERISDVFTNNEFSINGVKFDDVQSISKDNDDSSDWHIDVELSTEKCDLLGKCE